MKRVLLTILIIISILCTSCKTSLLEAPVDESRAGFCLTFDDRYITQWGNIKGMLDSNNVHATFFVTDVSKLTSSQVSTLRSLYDSGYDIGCHSVHHLNAIEYLAKHSVHEYIDEEIRPDLEKLSQLNIYPTAFSFPYGETTDSLNVSLLKYFKILRTVAEEQRTGNIGDIQTIESIYTKYNDKKIIAALGIDKNFNISLEMIEQAFMRAKSNNEIVVLYSHCPVEKAYSSYQTEIGLLRKLIALAAQLKLRSYSFSELVK